MTNKQYLITLAAFAILAAICVLAIRGCQANKTVILTPTERTKDSVNTWYKQAEVVIDSLIVITKQQAKSKDSLKAIKERQEQELYVKGVKINMLVKQAQLQAKYLDTIGELQTVDSILPQVAEISQKAEDYLHENRLLQNSYDSLLSTNSLHIARLDYDGSVLKESFDKVTANAVNLEKINAKLSKPKRFGLGAGIGYGFDGYRLKPVVSLGLHYSLLKF